MLRCAAKRSTILLTTSTKNRSANWKKIVLQIQRHRIECTTMEISSAAMCSVELLQTKNCIGFKLPAFPIETAPFDTHPRETSFLLKLKHFRDATECGDQTPYMLGATVLLFHWRDYKRPSVRILHRRIIYLLSSIMLEYFKFTDVPNAGLFWFCNEFAILRDIFYLIPSRPFVFDEINGRVSQAFHLPNIPFLFELNWRGDYIIAISGNSLLWFVGCRRFYKIE